MTNYRTIYLLLMAFPVVLINFGGAYALDTPDGCPVETVSQADIDAWCNQHIGYIPTYSQLETDFTNFNIVNEYEGTIVTSLAWGLYWNCHGYAWHISEGLGAEWINASEPYYDVMDDCLPSFVVSDHSEGGLKIRYTLGTTVSPHSAVINEDLTTFRSKWGIGMLADHLPDQVPVTFYGSPGSTYKPKVGACRVEQFRIAKGWASWSIVDEDGTPSRFQVVSSINGTKGPWVEIGAAEYGGVGRYGIPISTDDEDMAYRLWEVSPDGNKEVGATFIPTKELASSSSPLIFQNQQKVRDRLEDQIKELGLLHKYEKEDKNGNLEVECIIYCPTPFLDDVQDYLVSFWEDYMGVGVELVDVGGFSTQSDQFREELKASISLKASEGVELFHLIGDASEWEEVAEMDPVYYPFNGQIQPERDLIPTFYLEDSATLTWARPYYSSDFPYSDLNDDGFPDVVVTRWPVATKDELLPRISKLIEYNKNRDSLSNHSGSDFLALIKNLSIGGNSGTLAEEAAYHAIGQIPEEANINVTVQLSTDFQDGYEEPQVLDLWNSVQPETIFLWSPHSYRFNPNYLLDIYSAGELGETYPALVVASNCLTADFSRTDSITSPDSNLAADVYCQWYDRGSIAWVGPTSASIQVVNKTVTGIFARTLFEHPEWTMAKAWLESIREALVAVEYNPIYVKNVRTYAFLGDPLSRLEKKLPSSTYIDITDAPLWGQHRVTNSAEWVDFDSDGDDDLYLAYGMSSSEYYVADNKLVQNNGVVSLVDITPEESGDSIGWSGSTISAAWADMDNDGDQDVYLANGDESISNRDNVLLKSSSASGELLFSMYQDGDIVELGDANEGGRAEWVDVDSDGDLDLFVGRPNRTPLMFKSYVSQGAGGLTLTFAAGLTDLAGQGFSSWGDFNGDGLVDVFVYGANDNNYLLQNNGDWTFTDVTEAMGMGSLIDGRGKAAAWGDYDNDGDFDLFVGFSLPSSLPNRLLETMEPPLVM